MASGENQGLQIALIVFVILTILLGVGTFFSFRSYQEQVVQFKTLNETATNDKKAAASAQDEINQIKQMIGLDASMPFGVETDGKDGVDKPTVWGTFNADMVKYAATFPEAKRYYRQAIEEHGLRLGKADIVLASRDEEVKQLKLTNETREKAKQPQIDEHDKRAKTAETDRDAEKLKIAEERTKINADKDALLAESQKKDATVVALQTEKKKEVDQRDTQIVGLAKSLEEANGVIQGYEGKGFEVPDGEIRWVNAGTHTVSINLGHADQLRRQISFSVYDPKANTEKGEGLKGSIEVTQILNEHLAVARIVNDDISNPMVAGDKIYTPLWHPGRGEHFAIMGKIDLDGDHKHDGEIIKDMISLAGGEVDAELDEQGKLSGPGISRATRYLLIGETSTDKVIGAKEKDLSNEAKKFGVRELDVTKFLDLVGWKDPKQVLRFGRGGNAEFQTPPEPDGGRPVAISHLKDQFKKRLPPAAASKSAYGDADKKDTPKGAMKDAKGVAAKAATKDQKQKAMP